MASIRWLADGLARIAISLETGCVGQPEPLRRGLHRRLTVQLTRRNKKHGIAVVL